MRSLEGKPEVGRRIANPFSLTAGVSSTLPSAPMVDMQPVSSYTGNIVGL